MKLNSVDGGVRAVAKGLAMEVTTRMTVMLVLGLLAAGQAAAQQLPVTTGSESEAGTGCQTVSPTSRVIVDTSVGKIRGTLMCLSEAEAWLLRDGRLSKIPLGGITRIRTPADSAWDGAAIGAVIPLIFWAVLCHECPAGPILKSALTYGMIGLTADALETNRRTLYRSARQSLSVGWKVRF